MKILSADQVKAIDKFTIEHEPVKSIDLMERASFACVKRITKLISPDEKTVVVCGTGNNGGDGLAIARLLSVQGCNVSAVMVRYNDSMSADTQANYDKLKERFSSRLSDVRSVKELEEKTKDAVVIIDALLGSGLNKKTEGFLAEVIDYLNDHFKKIISVDVPSGLFMDSNSSENKSIIHSSLTLTFQLPKLAFLLPENKAYVPEFEILGIGLHEEGINQHSSNYHYLTAPDVASLLKMRNKFSHKGIYGHALLLAGSKGKSGAAIISAKACMRSGAGLLTVHSNKDTLTALLNHLPEAMGSEDLHSDFITEIEKPENFSAIGFGPGVGTDEETQLVLKKILNYYQGKLVIDADGLNILSENKTWLSFLPPAAILTPHPKEFERLTEKHDDDFSRLNALKQFSAKHNCIVVLKGAHSVIAMPDGNLFFNSSGNAGLAKAGSGDGLTGIILGLLGRGYNAPQSAIIGTFIHGYAADICLKKKSMEGILISDVIEQLPKAFKKLEDVLPS